MSAIGKKASGQAVGRKIGENRLAYLLVAPTFFFILIWLVFPLGYALYCSFWRCDYLMFTKPVGFGNYVAIIKDPSIWQTILRTTYISSVSLAIALLGGTLIALWIHASKGMIAYVTQIIALIPWVTSMVVAAMLWKWIFQDEAGLINYLLRAMGIGKVGFLTNKNIAIYTLIFVMTWRVIGYVMVQVLAGLKAIPKEYEEAAFVDGANKWKLFWLIRFPLLKTPISISAIIVGLSNMNNLTVPLTLTAGGPGSATMTISIELYRQSFKYYHFGEASALSIMLIALNFVLMVCYVKAVKYEI